MKKRLAVVAVALAVFAAVSFANGLAGALVGAAELAAAIYWLMGKATARRDEVEGAGTRKSWLNPY